MITFKELLAMLAIMLCIWLLPWNVGLVWYQIATLFVSSAIMAFLVVGTVEEVYEAITEYIERRHHNG